MKFVKGLKYASLLTASSFLLAACGDDAEEAVDTTEQAVEDVTEDVEEETEDMTGVGELQDGMYSLEEAELDENGWRVLFDITVEDGEITESNYNYENEEGTLKTEDEEYQENMTEAVGTGPQDYIPQFNEGLLDTQDPEEVEVVSGATHSHEKFVEYGEMLIEAAEEGNTEAIIID
ncbi:FMN-binding protein [Lacticigenium naphthae]|uniref:FMN-binding protein n=1 Tax=Lacticigenium naphthae TaxID=515351 RepID=UPI00040E011F|nr:lipoprotein [Lacticigenium naphthae]